MRQGPPPSIVNRSADRWSAVTHCPSLASSVLFAFFLFSLLTEGVSYPRSIPLFRERLIFSKFFFAWENFSRISRSLWGLPCMSMRRSSVSWACCWFNNAVVRAWIRESLSLPWLFSRQTKLKETQRRPGSDLEEEESVCVRGRERGSRSISVTPGERLRQSIRKQTKMRLLVEG